MTTPRFTHLAALSLALAACGDPARPAPPPAPLSPAPAAESPAALPAAGEVERVLEGGEPQALVRRGAFVYVADRDGLSVHEVDAGGRLALKAHVSTPGEARDVALDGEEGGVLYLADGRAGLARFALDAPDRPRLLGHQRLPGAARRVVASARGVAVMADGGALTLLRPGREPVHLALPGDPRDAAWVGPQLYVADTGDGLARVDPDAAPPRVVSTDRAFRWATSLAERDGRLLVGSVDKRVSLLDVSREPARVIASVTVDHRPARLFLLGDQVLAAATEAQGAGATLLQLDLAGGGLTLRARTPIAVLGAELVAPSLAVAARGPAGLELLSTDPFGDVRARAPGLSVDRVAASPERVVAWAEGAARAFSLPPERGARAAEEIAAGPLRDAVPCADALCTLDPAGQLCRRPASERPGEIAACARVAGGGRSIAWQPEAGLIWLLDEAGGLQAFAPGEGAEGLRRVAAASRPATMTHEQLDRLAVEGARAAAIDPLLGVLQLFDLGAAPRRRGAFALQARPAALALAGGVALVAEPSAGLQVVDVSDPDRPRELAWIPLDPGPRGVAVLPFEGPGGPGGVARVALAEGEAGLSLWAWDGRGALRPLARSDTAGVATDVAFAGGSLWIADGTGVARCAPGEAGP